MSMVPLRGAENTCHSRDQVPVIPGVTRSSSKAMTTQALWGVGDGGGGALVVIVASVVGSVVGNAVAHAVHVVDVRQAFCPPGPIAQVDTAPLARQIPVGVELGVLVSVGMPVRELGVAVGLLVGVAEALLVGAGMSVGDVLALIGSVKSGGTPVGLGSQ
jgi:hypothetical protein